MKRVTMKDIAQRLGISINSVSLALNQKNGIGAEMRKKILDLADELGYFQNKSRYLNAFAGKNICALTSATYFRIGDFYRRVNLGIEKEANANGYDIKAYFFTKEGEIPECVAERRVCGLIVVGQISESYLTLLMNCRVPIVVVDHYPFSHEVDTILSDNKSGTYQMTRILIEKGYTKIGFFGDILFSTSIQDRFNGYLSALKFIDNMQSYVDMIEYAKIYSVLDNIEEHIIENNFEELKFRLESVQERPQAWVCSNDEAAIRVIKVLSDMGIHVPEEIAVTGFDDLELSQIVTPHLTTVHVHREHMGRVAVRKLLWRLEYKTKPIESTILSVNIVERESVGFIPKSRRQ